MLILTPELSPGGTAVKLLCDLLLCRIQGVDFVIGRADELGVNIGARRRASLQPQILFFGSNHDE